MSAAVRTARLRGRHVLLSALLSLVIAWLAYGSWSNPDFWMNPARRGDRLMVQQQFRSAAQTYQDPWRIGTAQYRDGDFKAAAATFARVPGAVGAFNRGNAQLMHGAYEEAIASYQQALGFRPGWQAAADNMALARARKALIDNAGREREQESADAYKPDDTVFDQKGEDKAGKPQDMNQQSLSDEALRASWLRRVQTTPGDFLRAKFAYQAAHREAGEAGAAPEAAGEQP
ncbi:hypothetical protein [Haliea sp. E17]|uniref:hypothetical protein n=1 Tax=Haliea sp. E17 TaxID=3401576 RepID=UPI003AAD77B8